MRRESTRAQDGGGTLAQSEVIGVIIILGITFTGISIIWVTGNPSLEDTKDLARTSTAQNGLTVLDERVSSAALSGAEKKRFTLNLQSGELSVSPEGGSIRIFSSSPSEVLAVNADPGVTDAVHTLNFTIEEGSPIAGNATDAAHLKEITVRYTSDFDVGGSDGSHGTEGIDTNLDGSIDRSLNVLNTNEIGSNVLEFEFAPNVELNATHRITMQYDDIDHPSVSGEYDMSVTVRNDEGEAVTKEMTFEVGEDVEPPVRQIDTRVSMGKIEYETDDSVLAYQNGGVWRKLKEDDELSRTISKPEVYYDGNTLTASIINITNSADISLGGRQSLTATNTENDRVFPVRGTQRTNPLQDRNVYIEVNTSYYNAWSEYFESETVGDVVEVVGSGEQRTVRIELSPLPDTVFNQAIASRSGNVTLRNSLVDSYDSSVSDYSTRFRFGNADITAGGNLSLEEEGSPSRVYGNLLSDDRVFVSNGSIVNGSVKAHGYQGAPNGENITVAESGGGCRVQNSLVAPGVVGAPDCPPSSKTEEFPSETVPNPEFIDQEIDERIAEYNDSLPGGPTIGPGNYIVDSDETFFNDVTFDTTGGPVNIAVNNSDYLGFVGNTVEINGTYPVRVYSGNSTTAIDNIPKIEFDGATMDVENNRTDLFTVFVRSTRPIDETNVTVQGGSEIYGTVYAPDVDNMQITGSTLHGAVVTDAVDVANSAIHYDQRLRDPEAEGISAVNYLHVTDNRVNIR